MKRFDFATVKDFYDRHGLCLIEDNCDAFGLEFEYEGCVRLEKVPFLRVQTQKLADLLKDNGVEESGIQTKMLFAGNMIRHSSFDEMRT